MPRGDEVPKVTAALRSLGISYHLIPIIPFSEEPLEIPTDRKMIFYGSVSMRSQVLAEGRWTPGVFYDEERFSFRALREGYGLHLLNCDATLMTVRAFLSDTDKDPWEDLFIRPAHDSKSVMGKVLTRKEWVDTFEITRNNRHGTTDDTLIVVAPPQNIEWEWRLFVVDGEVVGASSYRYHMRLNTTEDVPQAVRQFAEFSARAYSPSPVFVIDICERRNGELKVVETNSMNCSGMYNCDIKAIVGSITDYVRRMGP